MYGFYRVSAVSSQLRLADIENNTATIIETIQNQRDASVLLFPELSLSGYSLEDLFFSETLYTKQLKSLKRVVDATKGIDTIIVLGIVLLDANRLYNCAAVLQDGKVLALIPKTYIPNKKEFYEKRHFNSGGDIIGSTIEMFDQKIPFGVDIIIQDAHYLSMGIEICEDLWSINPPSNRLAANGATLILNLSASNELIGKSRYREMLVTSQSARAMCAYAYASSGFGESTSHTLFGGECMIAEYGTLLAKNEKFSHETSRISADIDLQKLAWLRVAESSFSDLPRDSMRYVKAKNPPILKNINASIDPTPFVPKNSDEKAHRCKEIIDILSHSLIARMQRSRIKKAVIGVSGGLDSTLALLATHQAFKLMDWDHKDIIALTMPGFGTTETTKKSAIALCNSLEVDLREIDITNIAQKELELLEHDTKSDVVFENVQARARTSLLMNCANKENGLVIGTGDMSEIALGWSTYNGDHMSMYALNSGIPKTLIRYLIEYFMDDAKLAKTLRVILDTPVSPELLEHKNGEIIQKTEEIVGPYELHDFFLYHFVKYGASPSKILFLAQIAFDKKYDKVAIKKWLELFIKRFFTQQFKRETMPDGPKVGVISLNPRTDWRMPSDADMSLWLKELEGA